MRYLCAPAYVLSIMAVVFGSLWVGPYTGKGPPGTFVEPVQAAEKTDKAQDRVINPVRVATVSYRLDPPAQKAAINTKPETSLPWSCETIRQAAARLSREQRERLARVYRLNDKQKAEAARCLLRQT